MERLAWRDEYLVSVEEIDDQHRRVFAAVGELQRAADRSREAFAQVLRGLAGYAVEHFSAEERLMEESGYPGFAAHQGEHQRFTRTLLGFEAEFQAGRAEAGDLLLALTNWLPRHITGEDREMGAYLQTRRGTPE